MSELNNPMERLANVAEQLEAMRSADKEFWVFSCPYCGGQTKHGADFCCRVLAKAVNALMDAEDLSRLLAHAEKIAEKVSGN